MEYTLKAIGRLGHDIYNIGKTGLYYIITTPFMYTTRTRQGFEKGDGDENWGETLGAISASLGIVNTGADIIALFNSGVDPTIKSILAIQLASNTIDLGVEVIRYYRNKLIEEDKKSGKSLEKNLQQQVNDQL